MHDPSLVMRAGFPHCRSRSRPPGAAFSCHAEAAGGGLTGEAGRHIGQSLLQSRGIQPGAGDGPPGDLILAGQHLLAVAHRGLDGVPDGLGLCLGLLDEVLDLAQFPGFGLDLVDAHGLYLLVFWKLPAAVGIKFIS